MQRAWSWFRNPSFLVVLLSFGAIRPILTPSQTPLADDFAYHLHRLIALRHLVSEGIIFTRWFPDLALGYGYPLFNFAAPLPYYVALPFSWLFSAETAVQLTLALAMMCTGWGMLQLQRCFVPPTAALIGATAWLYAPYLLYDLHFRANLGEVFAIACLPFTLWGMTKLVRTNRPRWLLLTACAIAATLLSHNIIGLLLIPIAFCVAVALIATQEEQPATTASLTIPRAPFAALLLGLSLATFFWLPAFVEKGTAAFPRLMSNPAYSVFNNFLSLRELLALPPLIYANQINPSPPITLGLIPLLLALLGWVGWSKMTRQKRVLYALLTIATGLIAFMVTGYAAWIWQQIALLQFFQFPWRLLAFGALFVSIMIGFSAENLPKPLQIIVPIVLILHAQSWTLPAYAPKGEATLTDVIAYEQAVGTLGTTVAGEYLPNTVDVIPAAPASRLFVGEGIVEEMQEGGFRPNFTTTLTHSAPQTLLFNQFAFAGWHATVNGEVVPITPSEPNGLISIPVPAGTNTVNVQFSTTPLRFVASFLSFASCALLISFARRLDSTSRRQHDKSTLTPLSRNEELDESNPTQVAAIWLAPLALLALLVPLLRPTQSAENSLAGYGDVRLVSAEFPQSCRQNCLDSGQLAIPVELTFATDAAPTQILQSKLTLHDKNGVLYSLPDSRVQPRFRSAIPSNAWPPNHIATDAQLIELVTGIPNGDYTIELTVFDRQTLQPLRVEATNRTSFSVGTITIDADRPPISLAPPIRIDSNLGQPKLLGYAIDRTEAHPGDPILLSLFWNAESELTFSPDIYINELPAVRAPQIMYSISADQSIQTRHLLHVPAEITQSNSEIFVHISEGNAVQIPIQIAVPERTFTPPGVAKLVQESLGDVAVLYGLTVIEDAGEISAEIVWQARQQTDTHYRVFVHLIDANDNILAQSDADPANWTLPTTGWLPGEYIRDVHTLPAPDQPYRLRIGLYDPMTLTRPADPIVLALTD